MRVTCRAARGDPTNMAANHSLAIWLSRSERSCGRRRFLASSPRGRWRGLRVIAKSKSTKPPSPIQPAMSAVIEELTVWALRIPRRTKNPMIASESAPAVSVPARRCRPQGSTTIGMPRIEQSSSPRWVDLQQSTAISSLDGASPDVNAGSSTCESSFSSSFDDRQLILRISGTERIKRRISHHRRDLQRQGGKGSGARSRTIRVSGDSSIACGETIDSFLGRQRDGPKSHLACSTTNVMRGQSKAIGNIACAVTSGTLDQHISKSPYKPEQTWQFLTKLL